MSCFHFPSAPQGLSIWENHATAIPSTKQTAEFCIKLLINLAYTGLPVPPTPDCCSVVQAKVAREGTKKTVFTNYMELCKTMNRQPEHVQLFLLAELGTSGSLDGQQRLVVKGRFQPKAFEGVLRRYVNE